MRNSQFDNIRCHHRQERLNCLFFITFIPLRGDVIVLNKSRQVFKVHYHFQKELVYEVNAVTS
ncbi:hypothetical protein [Salmonella phage SD-1_S14]|nr:hypothetical protein [Salmonella phage SD-2_S15]WPK18889.1 hypothetical protein [Salmonella phage SD-6_S16]WPK19556.1 hypothetical protein [Salmonella phage SD-1_S14]WPK20584.1 hypothetical protein [Salmonella phage SD-15_S21]